MKKLNKKLIFSLAAMFAVVSVTSVVSARGKAGKPQNERAQWYLSTTISVYDSAKEVTHTGDNPSIIGKLTVSKNGHDKHDITPFTSLSNSKAAMVFVQDNWGERSGEYLSDYRSTRYRNDDWAFTVVSTVNYGEVTLDWSGLNELTTQTEGELTTYKEKRTLDSRTLERLHLIDLKTGEVVDALAADGTLNNYSFEMAYGETQHNFRWVLGPVNATHYKTTASKANFMKSQQQKASSKQKAVKMSARSSGDKFGLPPQ